jgi:hypothetical protein
MPKVNFQPLPVDRSELIASLKTHIEQSEKSIIDFEHRHYNGTREKAVIYCLRHVIDLAKGCIATAELELVDSLVTLSRACLETLFWARYVTISKEHAQEFVESTLNELKRVARNNMRAGYLRVRGKISDDDKTKEILSLMLNEKIPDRIAIKKAADLGGLERIYTNIYGYISMIAHGRAFGIKTKSENQAEIYASLGVTLGALQGVEMITIDWIVSRKQTSEETLTRILVLY